MKNSQTPDMQTYQFQSFAFKILNAIKKNKEQGVFVFCFLKKTQSEKPETPTRPEFFATFLTA